MTSTTTAPQHLYSALGTRTKNAIQLASGNYFDLLNPTLNSFTIRDVALGLEQPRFKNQCSDQFSITIGEHSLRCARIALALGQPLEVVLALLFHDAGEFALGDFAGPLKSKVRIQHEGATLTLDEVEARIRDLVIAKVLQTDSLIELVVAECSRERGPVQQIDAIALRAEALLWLPGSEDWASHRYAGPVNGVEVEWHRVLPAMNSRNSELGWGEAVVFIEAMMPSRFHDGFSWEERDSLHARQLQAVRTVLLSC